MGGEIDTNALERHFGDTEAFAQIDLVAHLADLDRRRHLAIDLANPGVQFAHLAGDRRQRRLVLPADQAITQFKFGERPEQWLGHRFGFGHSSLGSRLAQFIEQAEYIEFALTIDRQTGVQTIKRNALDGKIEVDQIGVIQIDIESLPAKQPLAVTLREFQARNMGAANHGQRKNLIRQLLEDNFQLGINGSSIQADRQ